MVPNSDLESLEDEELCDPKLGRFEKRERYVVMQIMRTLKWHNNQLTSDAACRSGPNRPKILQLSKSLADSMPFQD